MLKKAISIAFSLFLPLIISFCNNNPSKVQQADDPDSMWVKFTLNGIQYEYSGGYYPLQIQDKSLYSEGPCLIYYPKDHDYPGFLEQYDIIALQNTIYDSSSIKSGIAIGIIYDSRWKVQVCLTDSNGNKLESNSIVTDTPAIDTTIQIGDMLNDTLHYKIGFSNQDTITEISFSVRRIH